jgi:hypothetical protein
LRQAYKTLFLLFDLRPQTPSWEEALSKTINICLSYSKKLREIARLLWPYAMQFARVGISFTELYSIKTELKEMFASSEEIKTFWMQQNSPPAVLEQTSSQS